MFYFVTDHHCFEHTVILFLKSPFHSIPKLNDTTLNKVYVLDISKTVSFLFVWMFNTWA